MGSQSRPPSVSLEGPGRRSLKRMFDLIPLIDREGPLGFEFKRIAWN